MNYLYLFNGHYDSIASRAIYIFFLLVKSYHLLSALFFCVGFRDLIGTCSSSFIILIQILGPKFILRLSVIP
jgi:hypothetical protein